MSQEILSVLEYMEKEKGIPREDMISAIANAIRSAATKGVNAGQELRIEINPKNGALKAWSILEVVDSVGDPRTQIHIEKARQLNPDLSIIARASSHSGKTKLRAAGADTVESRCRGRAVYREGSRSGKVGADSRPDGTPDDHATAAPVRKGTHLR